MEIREIVTVLFADVTGSTALGERLERKGNVVAQARAAACCESSSPDAIGLGTG